MSPPVRTIRGELPDCLAGEADNSFDAILSDPPWGLSEPPPILDLIDAWRSGEDYEHSAGFLGRAWDSLPPSPRHLRELLRVLKPGGHAAFFFGSRTADLLGLSLRMAGFEVLPMMISLRGSAMSLAADVGKLIDEESGAEREVVGSKIGRPGYSLAESKSAGLCHSPGLGGNGDPEAECLITAPTTPLAQAFDGYHNRLRDVLTVIMLARKPTPLTLAQNAERWGVAGLNIGECGVAGERLAREFAQTTAAPSVACFSTGSRAVGTTTEPRYPTNILLSCPPECGDGRHVEGCPAGKLQALGERTSGGHVSALSNGEYSAGWSGKRNPTRFGGATQTPDRYFYQARASKGERNAGAMGLYWRRDAKHPDGWQLIGHEEWEAIGERDYRLALERGDGPADWERKTSGAGMVGPKVSADQSPEARAERARETNRYRGSPHPTVKALELVAWVARLLRPPELNGNQPPRILVPYSGTGSEAIGALLGGWRDIVCAEMSPQWVKVAEARTAWWWESIRHGGTDVRAILSRAGWQQPEPPDIAEDPQLSLLGDTVGR